METAERRTALLKLLCRRRYETTKNLAMEFGVSERTIRRDIETLSLRESIYTKPGRFGGGVYVVEGYNMDKMYIGEKESAVLHKLLNFAERDPSSILSSDEICLLKKLIKEYSKPPNKKKAKQGYK